MKNDLIRINLKVKKDVDKWLFDFLEGVPLPRRCEEIRHILKIGLSVKNNVVTSTAADGKFINSETINQTPLDNENKEVDDTIISTPSEGDVDNKKKGRLVQPADGMGGLLN